MMEPWSTRGISRRHIGNAKKCPSIPIQHRGMRPARFIPESRPEPSDNLTCDVAIVGGGLGGMALAGALQHRGFDAQVFGRCLEQSDQGFKHNVRQNTQKEEAAAQTRIETSTLIGLGQNALKALDSLHPGNVDQVKARGCQRQVLTRTVRAHKAHNIMTQSFPLSGTPYIGIRWSQMQDLLSSQVPCDALHGGYRAVGYTEQDQYVRVHFQDKADVTARLVVAADGLRSALRGAMIKDDPGPRFLGQMSWSALIHNPYNSIVEAHTPGELQVFRNHQDQTRDTLTGIVSDAGAGYTFWSVTIHSQTRDYTDKSRPGGLGCPGSKARVEELMMDVGWEGPLRIVQATPEAVIFERALMDRVPLDELGASMTSAGGRVMLMGDAAHAMHPKAGQGARTTFEDAHTLVQLLERYRDELYGWQVTNTHGVTRVLVPSGAASVPVGVGSEQVEASAVHVVSGDDGAVATAAGDGEVLKKVGLQYNASRRTRTCRVQRYASESCGVEEIREGAIRMSGASKEEVEAPQRHAELLRWLDQYPDNLDGDPDSVFWKPQQLAQQPTAFCAEI